ncbi:MAG: hypothetical protein E6Q33_02740 [Neisseriales bacterium]|nr:MAG: hypothetical protein E6Q33_02740 [Neisseriales bacterium]
MSKFTPIKTAFNAGELSPLMQGRTDIEKYAAACQEMTNFIPLVQGAATRRPGTRFVAEVKNSANRVWLRSFVFNFQQSFILEFGNLYIRFYNNYAQLQSGMSALEVATPYTASDLTTDEGTFGLSLVQSGDVIYIANRNHAPRKLNRISNTNWTLTTPEFKGGPFEDNNTDKAIKVTVDGLNTYIGSDFAQYNVTLSATGGNVFTTAMIGTQLQLEVTNDPIIKPWASQLGTSNTTDVGDVVRNDGKYYGCNASIVNKKTWYVAPTHNEGGRWDGDEVSWWYLADQIGVVKVTGVTNGTTAAGKVLRQIANTGNTENTLTSVIIGSSGATLTSALDMNVTDNPSTGVIQSGATLIGSAPAPTPSPTPTPSPAPESITVTGDDLTPVFSTSVDTDSATSWAWSKAAWRSDVGYPSHVAFYRERLVFARDQKLWFSCAGDYENFSAKEFGEILDDSAITLTVPFDQVSQIAYLVPTKVGLVVGSTDGEALVSPSTQGEVFSPSNVKVDITTYYGGQKLQPARVDNAILFVQRTGRKLRESVYDFNTDNLLANDVTILADHITESGIVDISFQREPYNVLWCARKDGVLLGFTYNRAQNVTGWHKHILGGNGIVESLQVIPSYDGARDDLWLVVKRTINGQTKRYIEFMTAAYSSSDTQENAYYVDCGVTYSGSATTTINGLTWLPNATVAILANGAVHANKTVTVGGQVETDIEVTKAQIGYPYVPMLTTMKLEGGSPQGTAQGKKKKFTELLIRLYQSAGAKVGTGEGDFPYTDIDLRNSNTPMGTPTQIYTGDVAVTLDAPITTDACLSVTTDNPLPVTVVAISPVVEVYEK